MAKKILIKIDNITLEGELNDTITSEIIWDNLPLEAVGNLWGDEVYFRTDISIKAKDRPTNTVEIGDIAFWPPETALCIFYGKTPVSTDNEIKPASSVIVVGKVKSNLNLLKNINENCEIKVVKNEPVVPKRPPVLPQQEYYDMNSPEYFDNDTQNL